MSYYIPLKDSQKKSLKSAVARKDGTSIRLFSSQISHLAPADRDTHNYHFELSAQQLKKLQNCRDANKGTTLKISSAAMKRHVKAGSLANLEEKLKAVEEKIVEAKPEEKPELADNIAEPEVKKKPRGRPRKNPIPSS